MKSSTLLVSLVTVAVTTLLGCSESVDTDALPSIDGYTAWNREIVTGPAPGHGDTHRTIYFNDVTQSYPGVGEYPFGSILVKEIRELEADDEPGDLLYIAIMRKIEEAPDPSQLNSDWLFTYANAPDADEVYFDFCWNACHAQAPIDATWYNYGLDF